MKCWSCGKKKKFKLTGNTFLTDQTSSQKASNGPEQLQNHACWKWRRLEVAWHNGKFSQRSVLISGRQRFYTWPEHIGNSSRSSSVLTPVKGMEEEKRTHFCLQFEEGDAQLWKSAGLPGGVSAMVQMSQSQRLRVQSHLPFLFLFSGKWRMLVETVLWCIHRFNIIHTVQ